MATKKKTTPKKETEETAETIETPESVDSMPVDGFPENNSATVS